MKTKLFVLLLSALLGAGTLVSVPAQAATGDCQINWEGIATCQGSNLESLRGNTKVTELVLENAPIKGDILATMPSLTRIDYTGSINVDLRNILMAPALHTLKANFVTKATRVEAGKPFKLPTFTSFDGTPFSFEIGDYFTRDGWKTPPVKQAGFNTFVAPQPTQMRFLDGRYDGVHKANNKSLEWIVEIGDQNLVTAYKNVSWMGSGSIKASYAPHGGGSVIDPAATVVPTGAVIFASGSKSSVGFPFESLCSWHRGTTLIQPAGRGGCYYQLTKADSGKKLTVNADHFVEAGDPDQWVGATESVHKTFTVQDPILFNVGQPKEAQVGKKLKAKVTKVPSGVKLAYQWYRSGKAIKGATATSYTPTAADVNKRISYSVTGSKPGMFSVRHDSYRSYQVAKGKYSVTKSPRVSGKAVYGQTLKVNPGTRSTKPQKYKYQWLRDGKSIKKATKSTYKLGTSDIGDKISVKVTATGAGFATQTSHTSKTKTVAKAKFSLKKKASVSGKMKVGSKLKANPGKWSPKPEKYKYQWYRSGAPISKATKSTYKVTSRDRDKVIYVKVSATKKGYSTKTSTSSVK